MKSYTTQNEINATLESLKSGEATEESVASSISILMDRVKELADGHGHSRTPIFAEALGNPEETYRVDVAEARQDLEKALAWITALETHRGQ